MVRGGKRSGSGGKEEVLEKSVSGDIKSSTEATEVPNYSQQNRANKEKDRVDRVYNQQKFEKGDFS